MKKDETIEKYMKYVYYDLAKIHQENKLSDEVGLRYEIAFERLLSVMIQKHEINWGTVKKFIKSKIFKTKNEEFKRKSYPQ